MIKSKISILFLLSTALITLAFRYRSANHKPPFTLVIDEPFLHKVPAENGDSTLELEANATIVNRTDDTIVYTCQWGQESKFYHTDNANIVAINVKFWGKKPMFADTILPHHSRLTTLSFNFKKAPDTTFSFRIGMNLLKWSKDFKNDEPDIKTIQQAPVIWSMTETMRTDKQHRYYNKTPEERKKKCEQLVEPLTNDDVHHYILKVDSKKIIKIKDTTVFYFDRDSIQNKGYRPVKKLMSFSTIPLKLSNSSDSTLTYVTWNCSWDEMYLTDNKDVS